MAQLGPFMGSLGGGGGGGGAQPAAAAAGEEAGAEAAEEPAPAEKTHYDVELQGFDAASKIKLIKEVRALLGLGLKEAKEVVETSPSWLKKGLAKADADALKATLEALGGQVRLA